jgi:hypothetical protein
LEDILKTTSKEKQIDIALLDFSKAFDTVPHQRLNNKLICFGICDNTLNWISSFLHNRTQLVLLDNVKSSTASVDSGMPQGTVLGPLLFLLYINDLPENVKANTKLFADDCLLYKDINNISDGQDLQNDLKALESWENEWQMSFNADKCFIIAAGTKNTKINYEYKIHNQDLEKVPLCTQ